MTTAHRRRLAILERSPGGGGIEATRAAAKFVPLDNNRFSPQSGFAGTLLGNRRTEDDKH